LAIIWLEKREVVHFHKELIAEHGGLQGLPGEGTLESTLARPRNLLAYEPECSLFRLAASYGYGFARNHCFPDGNKRVALISITVFLLSNGYELVASEVDALVTIRSVAAGDMDEQELSAWIESNSVKIDE
jgi:death-on-curing protein